MRGIGQKLEAAEGSRPPFYGVRCPEDGIELIDIGMVDIQAEQLLLHVGQQFVGFIEEGIEELAEIHTSAHACFLFCNYGVPAWPGSIRDAARSGATSSLR